MSDKSVSENGAEAVTLDGDGLEVFAGFGVSGPDGRFGDVGGLACGSIELGDVVEGVEEFVEVVVSNTSAVNDGSLP